MMQMIGATASAAGPDGGPSEPEGTVASSPRAIGIWKPSRRGDVIDFVADEESLRTGLNGHWAWAERRSIPADHDGRKRVVLLGESAARGFVFDPAITPGALLEKYLRERCGTAPLEVVDLACTGMGAADLLELARTALQLRPDAMLVFAGNNWLVGNQIATAARDRFDMSYRRGLARALDAGSAKAMRDYHAEQQRELAQAVVHELERAARSAGAALVQVVPEFNLRDWRHECLYPRWLPTADLTEWIRSKDAACAAASAREWDAAEAAALRMLKLDEGLISKTLEILGLCLAERGDSHEARTLLERARDASLWTGWSVPPRCPSVVQDAIRSGSDTCVDLPLVFDEHCRDGVPGRDLFLDYCHLTLRGMELAMEAAAEAIATRCGWAGQGASTRDPAPTIAPRDQATALSLAALHNAHLGQRAEIIEHWLRSAVDADASVLDSLRAYMACQTNAAPGWLCAAAGEAHRGLARRFHRAYRFEKVLDLALGRAIGQVAAHLDPAWDEWLDAERRRQRCIGPEPKDLTASYWRDNGSEAPILQGFADRGHAFTKEYLPQTRCFFFVDACSPLVLQIVARVPSAEGEDESLVRILVNGHEVGAVRARTRWTKHVLQIPLEVLRSGRNEVCVSWPVRGCPNFGDLGERLRFGWAAQPPLAFADLARLDLRSVDEPTEDRQRAQRSSAGASSDSISPPAHKLSNA